MSELLVTIVRLGYLAGLWIFILLAILTLRNDIFGTRVTSKAGGARGGKRGRKASGGSSSSPRSEPASRLVIVQGPLTGTSVPLGRSAILVGRAASCTLVLEDDYSSSRHARFFPRDGRWYVEDLGSRNGTIVGNQRINSPTYLPPGTPVRIGQTVIELRR